MHAAGSCVCSELRILGIQDVKRTSNDHTGFWLKQTDLEDFPSIFQQLSKVSEHVLILFLATQM